jgi:hypothetical protein
MQFSIIGDEGPGRDGGSLLQFQSGAVIDSLERFTFRSNHQESQNAFDASKLISEFAPT